MGKTLDQLNAELRTMTQRLKAAQAELRDYRSEVKHSARSTKQAALDFDDAEQQLNGFGAALRSVGGDIGPLEDLADAFGKLGPAGFAAAAGVAALVAGAFAVAKFTEATIEATRAAAELLDEWDHPEIFADQADAISDANQALDDLVFAGQRLQVLFAAGMSPAVTETVDSILALSLAFEDAASTASGWGLTLRNLADNTKWLAENTTPLGLIVVGAWSRAAEAVGYLTDAYEADVEALKAQAEAISDASDVLAEYIDQANETYSAERDFMLLGDRERERLDAEDRRRRERRAREEQRARDAALKAEQELLEQLNAERDAAMRANLDRIEGEVKAGKGGNDDLATANERARLTEMEAVERAAAAEAAAYEDAISLARRYREEAAYSAVSLADAVLAAQQQNLDTETAEGRKAARALFQTRKALGIAEVAIAAVVALQNAATLPWPANIPAVIQAGVTGAANAIAVGSVQPPSFPIGGVIPPDHRLISAQPGEAVLSTAAVRAAGEEQIGAMNRATSAPAGMEVAMVYRHRIFDRFVADNLRRSDSPLASAIQGSRRKRKRRR